MVSEKLKILVGKVKKRFGEIKPEDLAKFALKEASGSIPVVGQYIKDAIDEFSPDEKLELLQELKEISQNQFTELSKEIGVSVEYLKDIKTFTYDACAIQKADQEEIKGLLYRIINQTKFQIEKQNAENIYNIAGNLIINPITHEPFYIPSIQSVLRKGETTDGDFFKKEPEWVDYEQGFIVERKEVDEIINRLEKYKVQLVLGAPASGKSIILKNVGFRLANQNKVYMVELKKHAQNEIKLCFDNIPNIVDENPIFIVDDAHLNISECERLIRNFKGRGKGKLIIGSRETREITEGDLTRVSEFEHLGKTAINVKAEDVTAEMIKTFLKKQYNLEEDRIKTVSGSLEIFTEDLWFLSWALKSFNPMKTSVEKEEIYEKIRDSIRKKKAGEEKPAINAEDVLLPLSVFYRFEIPIERYFLEEQMGIERNIINQLIGLQEIREKEDIGRHKMLSLNHSSIAKLYFRSYQNFPDLGRKIKKKILNENDENDLEYCLFYRYLTTTDSRTAVDVVISLGWDYFDEEGGTILIENLIKGDKIQKTIKEGINKEKDIRKVESCVSDISRVSKKWALELVDSVSTRIDKEDSIEMIGLCIFNISYAHIKVALKLLESININILISKIEKAEIRDVGSCVEFIAKASEEFALKLVDSISIRIEKDEDNVKRCLSDISEGSEKVSNEIINRLNPKLREELKHIMP